MQKKPKLKIGQIWQIPGTLKVRVIVGRFFNNHNIPRDWQIVFKEPFRVDRQIKDTGYGINITVGEEVHHLAERRFHRWMVAKKKRPEAVLIGQVK